MKNFDIKTLTNEEFAMYNTSKLKFDALRNKYDLLAQFPPFKWSKDGSKSNLQVEFLHDLNTEISNIDEEDFITDRYVPFVELTKKYKAQINEASKIAAQDKHLGKAIKKWFDANGIEMDESVAYGYGV